VIRARLGADPEWQAEYFQRILPWLQHQDNTTLASLAGSPPGPGTTHQGAGAYELWKLAVRPGCLDWKGEVVRVAARLEAETGARLCGLWGSVFGQHNTAVLLWRHGDIDTAHQLGGQLRTVEGGEDLLGKLVSSESKLLAPTPFSPWQ